LVLLVIALKIIDIVKDSLKFNTLVNKREIFYRDVKLFGHQRTVDCMIEKLCSALSIPRLSMNIVPSPKGLVRGDLEVFLENGSVVEFSSKVRYSVTQKTIHFSHDIGNSSQFLDNQCQS
jgi:DNA topoisomerase VI subunit A